MKGNTLYKLDGQRTFYISHLNCFSSECFLARQGGSKASSRGCCHAGFLSLHFAVFCNSNFAYLQVSCLDIKTLCLCYIFYIITLDLVVIVLIVSIHSYKLNLKIIPGFPGLSDWSAGGPGCLNRCEFQPRIFLSQLLFGHHHICSPNWPSNWSCPTCSSRETMTPRSFILFCKTGSNVVNTGDVCSMSFSIPSSFHSRRRWRNLLYFCE